MPRINIQKKSKRGKDVSCGKCGEKIAVGQQYKMWAKRGGFGRFYSIKFYRCMKARCAPLPSELASGRTVELLSIGESLDAAIQDFRNDESFDLSNFYGAIDGVIGEAESLRDEMQEGFDNMPDGLQQGDTGQLIEQRIEALDTFIDELNSSRDQNDESSLDDDEILSEIGDADETDDRDDEERIAERRAELAEDIASEFEAVCLEC